MADWVAKYKPYVPVIASELRTGTVLRRVPFPTDLLGKISFGLPDSDGTSELRDLKIGVDAFGAGNVVISSAVVMTPDCDIYQHKCNAVAVAQVVSPEDHIQVNNYNTEKASKLRGDITRARSTNPGAFNHPGLVLLPGNPELGFDDSLVLLENHVSLPIEFAPGHGKGCMVTDASVGGADNLWFRIDHAELRIRLINEFARQMMRIGLDDA